MRINPIDFSGKKSTIPLARLALCEIKKTPSGSQANLLYKNGAKISINCQNDEYTKTTIDNKGRIIDIVSIGKDEADEFVKNELQNANKKEKKW